MKFTRIFLVFKYSTINEHIIVYANNIFVAEFVNYIIVHLIYNASILSNIKEIMN